MFIFGKVYFFNCSVSYLAYKLTLKGVLSMKIEIRCPKCNKRLFDVTEKTIGPIDCRCRCKNKVLVQFYSIDEIIFKI